MDKKKYNVINNGKGLKLQEAVNGDEELAFINKVGETFNTSVGFPPLLSQDESTLEIVKRNLQPESVRFDPTLAPILALGDSMTYDPRVISYPEQLAPMYGYTITNMGVGGETSTQIKTRWLATPANFSKTVIIWVGRNNFTNPNDPNNVPTVLADTAAIVSSLTHNRYLVIGVLNGVNQPKGSPGYIQMITLNNSLRAIYGNKFVPIREHIVSIYNPSIPQDVIDHNNDIPASSLRIDTGHMNTLGCKYEAEFILQYIGNMFNDTSYLQGKDIKSYLQLPDNLRLNYNLNLIAGQNFYYKQKNLNFDAGGTTDFRDIDNTTLNNDGNTFVSIIGKEFSITNNKNTNISNLTVSRTRCIHNGSGSVIGISATDALISGNGTGPVTNLVAYNYTPLSPANTFPITNYVILNNSGNFQNNIQNSYGVRIANLYGAVTARALDLNVTSGIGKYNIYAGANADNFLEGRLILNNIIRLKSYTVATLPIGTLGDTASVSDALAPTYLGIVAGSGTVKCSVFHNGTNWVTN